MVWCRIKWGKHGDNWYRNWWATPVLPHNSRIVRFNNNSLQAIKFRQFYPTQSYLALVHMRG